MDVAKIFWDDPYLTELAAEVTSVAGDRVTLDRTIAFAFSGGQESDAGTINGYNILRAEKHGKQISYFLPENHNLAVGDQVTVVIDWNRRYKLMRLHFAAEIILELVTQNFGSPLKIGAHITQDKARVDFAWAGNIAETFGFLEKETQRLIDGDLAITSDFEDRDKELRFWRIADFACVRCGGTHLKRTGEIGRLSLKRNNIGKGKERIEITLQE